MIAGLSLAGKKFFGRDRVNATETWRLYANIIDIINFVFRMFAKWQFEGIEAPLHNNTTKTFEYKLANLSNGQVVVSILGIKRIHQSTVCSCLVSKDCQRC